MRKTRGPNFASNFPAAMPSSGIAARISSRLGGTGGIVSIGGIRMKSRDRREEEFAEISFKTNPSQGLITAPSLSGYAVATSLTRD